MSIRFEDVVWEGHPTQVYCHFPCQAPPDVRETHTLTECTVPINPREPGLRPGWDLSGTRECPTLSPSIQCLQEGCGFHGYVRNGQVVR